MSKLPNPQPYDPAQSCKACDLKLPKIYCVNDKQTYHEGHGLSLISCKKLTYK